MFITFFSKIIQSSCLQVVGSNVTIDSLEAGTPYEIGIASANDGGVGASTMIRISTS